MFGADFENTDETGHHQYMLLTLCIRETPKQVLLQTGKTQMKCSIIHSCISSGFTLFVQVKKIFRQKNTIFWQVIT